MTVWWCNCGQIVQLAGPLCPARSNGMGPHLHIPGPGSPSELALCLQLSKLRCIIGICNKQHAPHLLFQEINLWQAL